MYKKTFSIPSAYEEVKTEELPDIHAQGIVLRHKKSGARLALIPCADSNKVFQIGFRTPPADSTGVAHIIEHTVLCGSRHFPIKDPFIELAKGSLNTFLNAMTYPDKTIYPVASTNDTDFRNLIHVYLDAVFYPNIYQEEKIFRQEGWNYHLDDMDGELTINGVVYNEMKGAFSSPDDVLGRQTMNALFPDTPYGVESGGDPDFIPDLTYEQYLDFHRAYYHPSNSYIYLYGDLDMEDTLRFIDEQYLRDFTEQEISSAIPAQKPFEEMRTVKASYPISDDEDPASKTYLSYNVVSGNPLDTEESAACSVLDYALLSSQGAPLKQALLDAGIGNDIYGGYSDGILQPYFSVTAKNAEAADADRFLTVIRDELKKQAEQGIDKKSLLAAINYQEFQFREADFAQFPKGLIYGISLMDTWLYSEDHVFVSLSQLKVFEKLRGLVDEGYFESLIKEKLTGNPHSALIILSPKKGMQQEKEEEIRSKLLAYRQSLSLKELEKMAENTASLTAYQEEADSPEALQSLPVLKIEDIKRECMSLSNKEETADIGKDRIPVVLHTARTNGIAYLSLLFDMRYLPEDLIPCAAVLKAVLSAMDTKERTYQDLNHEIDIHTGGISFGINTCEDPANPDGYQAFFTVRAKALYEKADKMAALISEILSDTVFDNDKRLYEILASVVSSLQVRMQQAGNATASSRALAYISPEGAFGDLITGIGYYRYVKNILDHFETGKEELKAKLKETLKKLIVKEGLLVSCTSEEEGKQSVLDLLPAIRIGSAAEGDRSGTPHLVKPLGKKQEGFMTSGQVQYVGLAGSYKESGTEFSGAMMIYRSIMSYEYLWQNVRVKGGAYGCGAMFRRSGEGICTSYRDPNLRRTQEVFSGIPDYLKTFDPTDEEMVKYIIGTISSVDTPLTPMQYGEASLRAYLTGLTEEKRQKTRNEILDAKAENIRALADAAEAMIRDGAFCVVGSESALKSDSSLFLNLEQLM